MNWIRKNLPLAVASIIIPATIGYVAFANEQGIQPVSPTVSGVQTESTQPSTTESEVVTEEPKTETPETSTVSATPSISETQPIPVKTAQEPIQEPVAATVETSTDLQAMADSLKDLQAEQEVLKRKAAEDDARQAALEEEQAKCAEAQSKYRSLDQQLTAYMAETTRLNQEAFELAGPGRDANILMSRITQQRRPELERLQAERNSAALEVNEVCN